jgi:glutaredoxin-related protein
MSPKTPPSHPAVAAAQSARSSAWVDEVAQAVASNDVVVVGVSMLQPGKKARQLLDAEKIPHHYLQYGSYLAGWRKRLALKLWVNWPTFPLIFIKGTFIGGGSELRKLRESGELKKLLNP